MCEVLQCVPIRYVWEKYATNPPSQSNVSCMSNAFRVWDSIAQSAVSAVLDWILVLLPVAMLCNTSMDKRMKGAVLVLLGLGAL